MAILQMQRINVYALSKYCKDILEHLQHLGAVELETVSLDDDVFYKADATSFELSYKRNAAVVKNALDTLRSYAKYKEPFLSSLSGRTPLTNEEYSNRADDFPNVLQKAYEIIKYDKKIIESRAKIAFLESRIESLIVWDKLDIPIGSIGTQYTEGVIGSFPRRINPEELRLQIAKISPDIEHFEIEIIYSDDNMTCVFALCHKCDLQKFKESLRKSGFVLPPFTTDKSPLSIIKEEKDEICNILKSIEDYKCKIVAQKDMIEKFRFLEDYFSAKSEQYAQIKNISYSLHTFVITGYVTKNNAENITKVLSENYEAEVELEDAKGDNVPVALSNNKFTEPVEGIVLSYSPPHRRELDPTSIMAVFYYAFFGLMFSDAGYGIVMSGACMAGLLLFPNMEKNLKRFLKMFFWCGVSTLFWGLMFGSFFGDAIKVIYTNFIKTEPPDIPGITTPIWFNPTEGSGPTTLLMFSFLLGIIHLFTGLIMQGIIYIRQKKFLYAVYDDLSWMLLVGGAVLMLLSTEMIASMTGFKLRPLWMTIGGILALAGALIILFFSARNKNPIKRFIKGAYNLYGATGYLSDILSYSRLLALGLATGVVAQVFNQLGAMAGSGVFGVIVFSIVFLCGHLLNIGINALGAYVHTNRLQFVEFFGKFYEGGGREFRPYKMNTKYYIVKEDY